MGDEASQSRADDVNLVSGDRQHDVEIAPRSSVAARVAFAGETQPAPRFDAGRNPDLQVPALPAPPLSVTLPAGLFDDLPFAAAVSAGARDGQESLGEALASGAPADGARFRLRAFFGSGALARGAALEPLKDERRLDSERGV